MEAESDAQVKWRERNSEKVIKKEDIEGKNSAGDLKHYGPLKVFC